MAYKIAIAGLSNTGKSFSRRTLTKGEEVFVISPSHKALHFRDSKGESLKRMNVSSGKILTTAELAASKGVSINALGSLLTTAPVGAITITGNFMVMPDLAYLEFWLKVVDKHMPHIKVLILPDFTHYISEILSQKTFISRKSGGEAYQRFWELAADALNNFITSIDALRDDLLVVTEYHCEYVEAVNMFKIFVPGGNMLNDKFLIDSYYDVMLYTHVLDDSDGISQSERYKFVTRRTDKYNARCLGLFEEAYIPNDLQMVIDKVRKYLGIENN